MEHVGAHGQDAFDAGAIRAGVMMNPPPAPMQPVMSPAARPMAMETIKMVVE